MILERLRYLHLLSVKKGIGLSCNIDNIAGSEAIVKKSMERRTFFDRKFDFNKMKKEMFEEFISLSNETPDINVSDSEMCAIIQNHYQ